MRSFWFEFDGDKLEIIFRLIKNGRWWYNSETGKKIGVKFDYPYPENDDEIVISFVDLEDFDPAVQSMLFQSLKLDAPEFGLTYS
ncbi:MAG: hypothetical protein KME60_13560 [Cyanomargarita calcarea GSE-NOS-MK-12-04C]|jgi:hypothetical protein|uniref:Uncharacterized protein n=1 Tax=Cyanomargarita calcarea GSE-NOS-MK-12-04C TaxID=2839659 RepID=A0A951QMX5_9CYAN|nr:hypothetical protein [Cyanomargarita calcarea GSE-NOS-MK-12-04C]